MGATHYTYTRELDRLPILLTIPTEFKLLLPPTLDECSSTSGEIPNSSVEKSAYNV